MYTRKKLSSPLRVVPFDQQKLHTDDIKSVRNPVRGADWSTGVVALL